jgi:hypothetical protein
MQQQHKGSSTAGAARNDKTAQHNTQQKDQTALVPVLLLNFSMACQAGATHSRHIPTALLAL